MPAFCVIAADDADASRRGADRRATAVPNVWDEDRRHAFELRGHAGSAAHLATSLLARRRRRRVRLRDARRPTVPARGLEHGAVPRLPPAWLPVRGRADDRELLRTARGQPPRRDGALRRRRWGPAARPAEPDTAPLHRGRPGRRAGGGCVATCGSRSSRRRAGRTASCTTVGGGCTRTTPPTARSTTSLVDGEHAAVARRDARGRSSSPVSRRC